MMDNGDMPGGPCCESLSADVIAQRVAHGGSNIGFIDHLGMTKREAFAMAARQGILSRYGPDEQRAETTAIDA
ncbi:MAG: hypothetical protein V3U97_02715, partial [bacterium]